MHISEIPDFFILRKKIGLQKKMPCPQGNSYKQTQENGEEPRKFNNWDGKESVLTSKSRGLRRVFDISWFVLL